MPPSAATYLVGVCGSYTRAAAAAAAGSDDDQRCRRAAADFRPAPGSESPRREVSESRFRLPHPREGVEVWRRPARPVVIVRSEHGTELQPGFRKRCSSSADVGVRPRPRVFGRYKLSRTVPAPALPSFRQLRAVCITGGLCAERRSAVETEAAAAHRPRGLRRGPAGRSSATPSISASVAWSSRTSRSLFPSLRCHVSSAAPAASRSAIAVR